MYKKEFEGLLKSPYFPNYFLVYGTDSYQVELFCGEILAKFDGENRLDFYFDEYDFNAAKSHLQGGSLFCDTSVLRIKTDKNIPTKDIKTLIEMCKKNKKNAFIYEFYEMDDKISSESVRAFEGNFLRVFAPSSPSEAISLLNFHAKKLGLNATSDALYQIYSLQNENLTLATSELNKLATLTRNIDENLVQNLVFSLNGVSFERFFDNIISLKNIKDDFNSYANDLNEILFINSLYSAFYRLFKINTYAKINGTLDLKNAIGYAPPINIANRLKQQALSINTDIYGEIFRLLNESEYELKTKANVEKESFLLATILSLQNLIAKNRKF